MNTSSPNPDLFMAPDPQALERMAEYAMLASRGELGEVFDRLMAAGNDYMPMTPEATAGWMALGLGIQEFLATEVERWANATLALFGLRVEGRHPSAPWTPEYFHNALPQALVDLGGHVRGCDSDGEAISRPLVSVDEAGRLATMSLAAGWTWAAETASGRPWLNEVVGDGYDADLTERATSAHKMAWLSRLDAHAHECLLRALTVEETDGRFAGLPRRIDRDELAADIRATLERGLAQAAHDPSPPPF